MGSPKMAGTIRPPAQTVSSGLAGTRINATTPALEVARASTAARLAAVYPQAHSPPRSAGLGATCGFSSEVDNSPELCITGLWADLGHARWDLSYYELLQ